MKHLKHPATVVAAIALFVALGGGAAAYASGVISGGQIKNHSIPAKKLTASAIRSLHGRRGSQGPAGPAGPQGPQGPQGATGAQGRSGFAGAFYSVQTYTETVGVGAIATAACDPNNATNSQKYVAISGGVQDTDSATNMTTNNNQVAVAASFPGRMDFSTFTPKPGRLDGWIIQFAHVGAQDNNLAVWALCVPVSDFGSSVPVHTN
jgi:hypothetical protein